MIKNYRELAKNMKTKDGMSIKPRTIFRSGELSKIDEKEKENLIEVGIKTIYDLRSRAEVSERPDNIKLNIVNYNVTNSDSNVQMDKAFLEELAQNNPDEFMISLYRDYLHLSPTLKPLFQEIINQKEPFLFHCAAGKDRTGVVGALIMQILGFQKEDIINEYVLLDPRVLKDVELHMKQEHLLSDQVIKKLEPLNTVKDTYIKAFLESIEIKFKSLDEYLYKFLDLNKDQITTFQSYYLE